MQVRDQTRFQQAQQAAAACERLLKERYGEREVHLFGSLAGQSPWHSRSDIDLAVEGLATALQLLDYLRFRHLFRHSYGYELQWEKLRPLIEGLEGTLVMLREQIEQFISRYVVK